MSYTITASDVCIEYMQNKINDEAINNSGINCSGDQVTILGSFTSGEKETINGFISGGQLDYAKKNKFSEVNRKTLLLVDTGFVHQSIKFPLVLDERSNYIGIQVFGGFPYKIQSRDRDDVLIIEDQSVFDSFINNGLTRFRVIKDGESDLIILIRDATTISAVNAIVDSRV